MAMRAEDAVRGNRLSPTTDFLRLGGAAQRTAVPFAMAARFDGAVVTRERVRTGDRSAHAVNVTRGAILSGCAGLSGRFSPGHSMKASLKLSALLLVGLSFIRAFASAPATLTLSDLRQSPERWPAAITVPRDLNFQGGASVKKGQMVKVTDLTGNEVVVDSGTGLIFGLPVAETDFIARANEAWTKLTPEQREVTAASLVTDRSLWPVKVRNFAEFRLGNGGVIKSGGEYELIAVERDGLKLLAPEYNTTLRVKPQATDLIERSRALVLLPPAKRPSRIAAVLRGHLVDASGRATDPAGLDETQVFALYYGASWCPPCRAFSPELVKFVHRVGPANPRLTVVLVSSDKTDAAMFGYMKEEQMPWVALPREQLTKSPALVAYTKGGIPQLVIVDRQGTVLADSYRGSSYVGPQVAMAELEKILASGAAK
jgi:nucleoredoxin